MSIHDDKIRIQQTDLFSPQVESYLETRRAMQRNVEADLPPLIIRVVYASWFYLAAACMLGAFCAWGVLEPFFDDNVEEKGGQRLVSLLIFPSVAAAVGLFLGAAEGLMCRNGLRALKSGAVGMGIGFVGGLIALIPCNIIFVITASIAFEASRTPVTPASPMPTGLGLLILMIGRGAAWSIISIPAGLGQGIALREKKVVLNGVVGAVLGGLIGGLLFDPISMILTTSDGQAAASRCVGFCTIGMFVGLFVGLVEGWTKTAWLLMKAGPLAGKQFIIYRDTTVLGSSPDADIYLFKDAAIEPRHAVIVNRGGRFELEDCNSADGTYVNGVPITREILKTGDQIILGKTVLEFALKENE